MFANSRMISWVPQHFTWCSPVHLNFPADVAVNLVEELVPTLQVPPYHDYVHVSWVGDVLVDVTNVQFQYARLPREFI